MFKVLLVLVLYAQQPDTAQLRVRMEAARRQYVAAQRVLARADSIKEAQRRAEGAGSLDTAQVGPFYVVAPAASLERVRNTFDTVWRSRAQEVGLGSALAGAVFVVQVGEALGVYNTLRVRENHHSLMLPRGRGEDAVWQAMRSAATHKLSPELRAWLDGAAVLSDRERALQSAYRDLALKQIESVHQCRAGTIARCLDALGLRDPGPLYANRYTADELRAVVWGYNRRRARVIEHHPCFKDRDAQACLDAVTNKDRLVPVNVDSRLSFLNVLLQQPGSFARLMEARGTVAEQLQAIAPQGLEPAAADWRAAVMRAEPTRLNASLSTAASTIIWLLILAAIGMRSTRWRLG